MSYSTSKQVLEYLGKDAYNVVRDEVVGTGNGTTSTWTTSQVNLVSTSVTLYTNSAKYTGSYSIDLDLGRITYIVPTGSVLSVDYNYSDVPDSQIQTLISSSDSFIETKTGRLFTQVTGNVDYISVNPNQRTVFLSNYPILTLSSVQARTDGSTFTDLFEGYTSDYIANAQDLSLGRLRFNANVGCGEDIIKATYDYGYATTPPLINELSKLLTIRQLANSSVYKSIFKGYDNFTPIRLDEIETRIEELFRLFTKQEINSI